MVTPIVRLFEPMQRDFQAKRSWFFQGHFQVIAGPLTAGIVPQEQRQHLHLQD